MKNIDIPAKDGTIIPSITIGFEDSNIKAAVIICHGFGEHAGCYTELAGRLHDAGFACIVFNQRGHGLPPENVKKWHGIIPSYRSFLDDVDTVTEHIRKVLPGVPIVLYGHSMGGNIVINALLRMPKEQAAGYCCAVLEAPWLGLYEKPNIFTTVAVRTLNVIMPNFTIIHKMRSGDLSTIEERAAGYTNDPLYHGVLSARMITGIFDACGYALENAGQYSVRTFLAKASDDVVVCNKAIDEFAQKAGSEITCKEYASKHAIHNDVCMDEYINDVAGFINASCG